MATIGTIGKYERLDVLGHGTSGVVYLAWDTLLRRNVALKEIRAAGPEMERVLDEARVLDRLGRHPHIVQVHSVDSIAGAVLIDMELIRGGNLADLLRDRQGAPLPPAEAVRITTAILDALAFAHEQRIIHRDVKPANILIGTDGAIKLTDFGLAEALGSGSVAGGGGTYPYMAPEDFAENAESDYRSDLWAVGVVAYEMLTGRRPFQVAQRTRDPFAWKRAITEEIPPPLAQLRPELPPALERVVNRALAKNKAERHTTARAFAADLRVAAMGLPAAEPIKAPAPVAEPTVARTPGAHAFDLGDDEDEADDHTFYFANGASATDLDSLLVLCARHWNEARAALADGRIEAFLRTIGEVYIADMAKELRSQSGDTDRNLREFLERSRGDEEPDDHTVPAAGAHRLRPGRLLLRRPASEPRLEEERKSTVTVEDRTIASPWRQRPVVVPADLTPMAAQAPKPVLEPSLPASAQSPSRWWFWPLYIVSVAPLAITLAMFAQYGTNGASLGVANRESVRALLGWGGFGFLNAILLILAFRAKIGLFGRILCSLAVGGGLIAAGALVSLLLSPQPTPDSLLSVSVLLMFPIAILLIVSATVGRFWRLWAWLTLLFAIALTLEFARPGLPRVVQFSHTLMR